MQSCQTCRGVLGSRLGVLFRFGLDGEDLSRLAPEQLAAFEQVLERSASRRSGRARRRGSERPRLKLPPTKEGAASSPLLSCQGAYPVYEALLARSWTFSQENPRKMVEYAWYATRAALCLEQEGFEPQQATDFQARALGELADAYRIADRLDEAEATLREAVEMAARGSGEIFLSLRLLELRASLLGSRRQYREALELLDHLLAESLRCGDSHAAGRILIRLGVYTGYLGDTAEALRRMDEGLLRVDPEREPHLRPAALHKQLFFLVSSGWLEQAVALLGRCREELLGTGKRLDRALLVSVEGRVQAGLGQLHLAEGALREAKETFEDLDVKPLWAVACLDLGAVLMALGRAAEARALAEEALWVFRHLRIGEGLLEALGILDAVLQAEILTAGLLGRLAEFVRRAEHDPTARFVPSF